MKAINPQGELAYCNCNTINGLAGGGPLDMPTVVVEPGYTPYYRIESAEVAGLVCEWRERSHLLPRNRKQKRRLENSAASSFPQMGPNRFGKRVEFSLAL